MNNELHGTGVALATPMNNDYSVDYTSLKKLVNHTLTGSVDYLVVMGTTGESPVFSWREKLEVLEKVISYVDGKKPIIFGHGGNNTLDLISKSKDLASFDLAGILSVSPYYSRPSQSGIIRHYQMLADAFPYPIMLYNVPSRTASNIEANTTLELANHERIIGIKDASGDLSQCKKIASHQPDDFMLISGDDALAHDIIQMGGKGVISVIANLLPTEFTQMVHASLNADLPLAEELNKKLVKAYSLLSQEGNPSSLKAGLEVLDICRKTVKPPLYDASSSLTKSWQEFLSKFSQPAVKKSAQPLS